VRAVNKRVMVQSRLAIRRRRGGSNSVRRDMERLGGVGPKSASRSLALDL